VQETLSQDCPNFFLPKSYNRYFGLGLVQHVSKRHNKLYTSLPKLVCNFYDMYIIYKCDRGFETLKLTLIVLETQGLRAFSGNVARLRVLSACLLKVGS